MATKNIVVLEKSPFQDKLQVAITIAPTWEDFEKLVQFLIHEYNAEVSKRYDGPDARRWILEAKGQTLEMWHDHPYGNYLVAPTDGAEVLVRKIAQDLKERLGNL